jgi:large subunit ribosomal protein L23
MKILSNTIVRPLISEKSFAEAKSGRYTFLVSKSATKTDVKNAVEKLFKVDVVKVFSANIKGTRTKTTRFSRKVLDASYKKARVALAEGQKLDMFEEKTEEKGKKKEKEQKK